MSNCECKDAASARTELMAKMLWNDEFGTISDGFSHWVRGAFVALNKHLRSSLRDSDLGDRTIR